MNRAHTAVESVESVKLAQDHGFDNISVDLIYGSKFQDLAVWEQTLRKTLDLNTQHISSYNLTIEDKTVLGLKHQKGQEPGIDDRLSSRQFLLMLDVLENSGFTGYEISNFGKQGFYAVHNTNYWLQQPYLGLGPSAHSFNGKSRQWNVKNNSLYIKAFNENTSFFEKEDLSLHDRYNEYILTRLRTIWGCDEKEIEKLFGSELKKHFRAQVQFMRSFIKEKDGIITLNRDGKLRADGLSAELFI
jgi:oxygen-independent coproporphyrinogen-3 oxidase